jgi:hypothetical protein
LQLKDRGYEDEVDLLSQAELEIRIHRRGDCTAGAFAHQLQEEAHRGVDYG